MRIDSSHKFSNPNGFIVLEGVNGAGKSTLLNKISDHLKASGKDVITTREPGSSNVGQRLRPIILDPPEKLAPRTELFLFAADRSQHVERVIRPAIKENQLVLSDRYYYSTSAFQGFGREMDKELVSSINKIAIDGLKPDAVILLDLDPQTGLARNQAEGADETDAFEYEQLAFHTRLREGFLSLAEELEEPFLVVNAEQSPDEVFNFCLPLIDSWLNSLESA